MVGMIDNSMMYRLVNSWYKALSQHFWNGSGEATACHYIVRLFLFLCLHFGWIYSWIYMF